MSLSCQSLRASGARDLCETSMVFCLSRLFASTPLAPRIYSAMALLPCGLLSLWPFVGLGMLLGSISSGGEAGSGTVGSS